MTTEGAMGALIEQLLNEARNAQQAMAEVTAQLAARRISQPIDWDAGTVTVNGHGQLVSVDLSRDAIRNSSPAGMAERVTAAIRAAEDAAEQARGDIMDSVQIGGIPVRRITERGIEPVRELFGLRRTPR